MFNSYHEHSSTHYVEVPKDITVHEHRAPTDKSIDLLNEMQDKARKNIIAHVNVQDNLVNGVSILYQNDFPMDSITIHLKFSINGIEYFYEEKHNTREFEDQNYHQYGLDMLKTRVLNAVTKHILFDVQEQLFEAKHSPRVKERILGKKGVVNYGR